MGIILLNEKAHTERADLTRSGVSLLSAKIRIISELPKKSLNYLHVLRKFTTYVAAKCHSTIYRAALAKALGRSGRQVRKAIDVLRDKRTRRKGGDSGEWDNLG